MCNHRYRDFDKKCCIYIARTNYLLLQETNRMEVFCRTSHIFVFLSSNLYFLDSPPLFCMFLTCFCSSSSRSDHLFWFNNIDWVVQVTRLVFDHFSCNCNSHFFSKFNLVIFIFHLFTFKVIYVGVFGGFSDEFAIT